MQEIDKILKIYKTSIENFLHQLGYVSQIDVWLPSKFSEKTYWATVCDLIHKCKEKVLFLKQTVMGDKKLIIITSITQFGCGATTNVAHLEQV